MGGERRGDGRLVNIVRCERIINQTKAVLTIATSNIRMKATTYIADLFLHRDT